MSNDQNVIPRKPGDAIMHGWLSKRGEHIRNWRPRYFFLYPDGSLLGFKLDPRPCEYLPWPPENDFKISHVQILRSSKRPSGFSVRCMQCAANEMIIRRFCASNVDDRDRWISAMTVLTIKNMNTGNSNGSEIIHRHEPMDTMESCDISPVESPSNVGTNNYCNSGSGDYGMISFDDNIAACPSSDEYFDFLKVLGRGTFGKVILCREKRTQKLYALKILQKKVIDEVEHTLAENRVLHNCKHPFLTRLEASFQTRHHLCYVLEFANGGELFFHLRRSRTFSESRTRYYGAEILLALEYLHDRNIIYRDMKLENLLLDKDGHIKLADFGLCKEDIKFGDTTVTFCGTPEYLAPDILFNYKYGRAVDWWGLGVVMYEMICGRLPFFSHDHEKLFNAIMHARPRYPSRLSLEARDLFDKLLEKDPTKRLGGGPDDAREVKAHLFFRGVDWDRLYRKEYPTPFRPLVTSETDTSNFDDEFTSAPVQLTPPSSKNGLQEMDTDDEYDDSAFDQFPFFDDAARFTRGFDYDK
uniref:non-specific serine/threonine protein kinase n=1 Tax=Syphacia muris TaxID=451379 RepID=A0A0N5APV0_9BILA